MIPIASSPALHPAFDLLAWASGAAAGWVIYRWRLRDAAAALAARARPGYFAALAAGAIGGAWLAGSLNTLRGPAPTLSHSVAGALAGAIVAVEIYKAARRVKGSTGAVFVGSFAVGVVDRALGLPVRRPARSNLRRRRPPCPGRSTSATASAAIRCRSTKSLAMALFLAVYLAALARRAPWAMRRGFYVMCAWYGAAALRLGVPQALSARLIGPFNLFHLLCLGLVIYGCVYVRSRLAPATRRARSRPTCSWARPPACVRPACAGPGQDHRRGRQRLLSRSAAAITACRRP